MEISSERLFELAKKMHLWIFLHTGDEEAAYDEIGLTEEENFILGYMGQLEVAVGEEKNETD